MENPMIRLGRALKITGGIVFLISGLWGLFLCLGIISKVAGFWGIVGALVLGPITLVAAPLYAGFAWGNWFPLILNYGGAISAAILFGIGMTLSRE